MTFSNYRLIVLRICIYRMRHLSCDKVGLCWITWAEGNWSGSYFSNSAGTRQRKTVLVSLPYSLTFEKQISQIELGSVYGFHSNTVKQLSMEVWVAFVRQDWLHIGLIVVINSQLRTILFFLAAISKLRSTHTLQCLWTCFWWQ
jgi:hypothetical protein